MQTLIILYSYHHNNTEKIAKAMSNILDAKIVSPKDISPQEIQLYDIIGFGSGIYGEKHHKEIINFVNELPPTTNKKIFIFSTSAITGKTKAFQDHKFLREKLAQKGCSIMGEFQCKGFNTNSFLKYLGGMNKNRPNENDLQNAKIFARNLKQKI